MDFTNWKHGKNTSLMLLHAGFREMMKENSDFSCPNSIMNELLGEKLLSGLSYAV